MSLDQGLWYGLGGVNALFDDTITDQLFVGGGFYYAGNMVTSRITAWDGATFDSLGHGIDNYGVPNQGTYVTSIVRYGDSIIAGGLFQKAGDSAIIGLAAWANDQWHSFGNPKKAIWGLNVIDNELYVCGDFDTIGGVEAHGIAKWDGSSWNDVFQFPWLGTNSFDINRIHGVISYNGELIVYGQIPSPGIQYDLAFWNGQQWNLFDVYGGVVGVNDAEIFNNELYVSGTFFEQNGNAGTGIMRYDGTQWNDVGGGMGGTAFPDVRKMEAHDGKLYCTGVFLTAGGVPAPFIAIWDGVEWCGLGSVFDNVCFTLTFFRDTLILGGGFLTIDGDSMWSISKWVGGNYVDTCGAIIGINETEQGNLDFSLFPNPAQNQITIYSEQPIEQVRILNLLGQTVKAESFLSQKQISIDVSLLAAGVYFVEVESGKGKGVKKVVKE